MPATADTATQAFRALADPTRRKVLERLSRHPATTRQLADSFDMALPSFLEHMEMLERVGLVRSDKVGRIRTYRLVPRRLMIVENWLSRQRTVWERRLDQLDSHLTTRKRHS